MVMQLTSQQQLLLESNEWLSKIEMLEKQMSDSNTCPLTLSTTFSLISDRVQVLAQEKLEHSEFRKNIIQIQEKCALIQPHLDELQGDFAQSLLIEVQGFISSSKVHSLSQEVLSQQFRNFDMRIRNIQRIMASSINARSLALNAQAMLVAHEKILGDKDGKYAPSSSSTSSTSSSSCSSFSTSSSSFLSKNAHSDIQFFYDLITNAPTIATDSISEEQTVASVPSPNYSSEDSEVGESNENDENSPSTTSSSGASFSGSTSS